MAKADLLEKVASEAGCSVDETDRILKAFTGVIGEQISEGKSLNLMGFGTFSVVERAARKGRNPRTGEELDIPAHKAVKFKPSKSLNESVN